MKKITFAGNPLTLNNEGLKVRDKAPDFTVTNNDLGPVKLSDLKGVRVISAAPSIDTPVCDAQGRQMQQHFKGKDVNVMFISSDLPFAQARWCGLVEGVENVHVLSDYKGYDFAHKFGCFVNELHLVTRAVFVIDANDEIKYVEYLSEITEHPNYEKLIAAVDELI